MRATDVSTQEWRWVAFWGGVLVTLTLIPYAWAVVSADDTWFFMGILPNPQDGASYFAKIRFGMDGNWLYELQHTPQSHEPAGLFFFYLLLGQIARIIGFSPFLIFHLARIAASLFMFTAIYRLGAHVWQRQRPRRLFWLLTSVASGLGWLIVPFTADNLPPDIGIPEAFPLYAAYANPHFPLSIGCLALMAGIYLMVFRPGYTQAPTAENGGSLILFYSVILAIIQPPALVAFGSGLMIFVLVSGYTRGEIPWHEIRWASMLALPTLPLVVYYILVFSTNDVFGAFNDQNMTPSPNLILTLFGYGILLAIALPGINRAVRRFERDGDQLMLLWLAVNVVVIYLPISLQRRLFIGMVIPIVYFAVRALEDYWFERIKARWQQIALIIALIFMVPSNFIVLIVPLYGAVSNREAGNESFILLQADYINAFQWLNEFGNEGEVTLASPEVSLWLPAETSQRVVYGHPFETVPSEELENEVMDFFEGRDCTILLDGRPLEIDYLILGPEEIEIGDDALEDDPDLNPRACIDEVIASIENPQAIQDFGTVQIYTLRELR